MTVHRWFANKSCPGDFLFNRHGYIAAEVNKLLNAVPIDETIWNFLKGKGLNDFATAGIMGNLFAESALKPTNLQDSFEKSLNMTNDMYTQAVDNGTYSNFVQDKAGYGLAQWTFNTRKRALLDFCKATGTSIGDLSMQLNFLWKELQCYKGLLPCLNEVNTVRAASDIILLNFERPADQSEAVQLKRAGYAQGFYNKFATPVVVASPPEATGFIPYHVTIKAPSLHVRKGPGINTPVVQTLINDKNIYTITEESSGPGASMWCKLKSGIGWVSKDYVLKK